MIVRSCLLLIIVYCIQCVRTNGSVEKGLYDDKDNVTVFNGDSLLNTLSTSQTLWLVEYYSSWCGHCQEFAPIFKALAKDVAGWSWLFCIGAINCGDTAPSGDENFLTCHRHPFWVFDYPEFRFYPAFSNSSNPGETYKGDQGMNEMRKEIIDYITKHITDLKWTHERPKPILRISGSEEVINDLSPSTRTDPILYTAVIFEDENSYVGKEVILDTSSCTNIFIRRVNVNRKDGEELAKKLDIDTSDLPQAIVIHRNGTIQNIQVKLKTRHFFTYELTRLPGVGEPIARFNSPFSQNLSDSYNNVNQVTVDYRDVKRDVVYLADIESAIRYSLTMEVAAVKVLEGKKLEGLKTFISAFVKLGEHMPARPSTHAFMRDLYKWLQPQESISYNIWMEKIMQKTKDRYLPPSNKLWVGCQPSKPSLRRYPCSLWTLFHTMTAASVNAQLPDQSLVPSAMAAYIINFFGCRECRINFMKEIKQMPYNSSSGPYSAILWLWRIHNSVNERLHSNSSTEDPAFPKLQFPPMEMCPGCHGANNVWNENNVAEYLIRRYSKTNVALDFLNFTVDFADDEKKKVTKEPGIELNGEEISNLTEVANKTQNADEVLEKEPFKTECDSLKLSEEEMPTSVHTEAINPTQQNHSLEETDQILLLALPEINSTAKNMTDFNEQLLTQNLSLEEKAKIVPQTVAMATNIHLPTEVTESIQDNVQEGVDLKEKEMKLLVDSKLSFSPDVSFEKMDEKIMGQIPPPSLQQDKLNFQDKDTYESDVEDQLVPQILQRDDVKFVKPVEVIKEKELENVFLNALVRPVAKKLIKELGKNGKPPETKNEIWEARLQNAQSNHNEKQHENNDKHSFHPRALGSNIIGRRGVGSITGSFRLQLGFSQIDLNLCFVIWFVSIGGALCLFWGYKCRRNLFFRRKNFKHVL